ncbi:MAG: methylenetetrahydrofolate reductase [NAD(P)H] [Actinobacteria bacterium]|nr:methylenetetrahydrofolate reductase [NAD(P)H] [Actinomycetota bacterium]
MRIDEILKRPDPSFSVEFFPPKSEDGRRQLFQTVEMLGRLEPAFFSVTYGAGGSTHDRRTTMEITRTIRDQNGIETMAHLNCVGETAEGLAKVVDEIAASGIENVLALRGDPPTGETSFEQPDGGLGSAAELTAMIRGSHPEMAIGGACFPEVHPDAESLEADLAYLKTKVDAGASFLITQLFFDNQVYFDFVPAARAAGIDVPIVPGVIPIVSFDQLKRTCALCDASIPEPLERALRDLGGDDRAEFDFGVSYGAAQCAGLLAAGAPGIHFYALNRWPATRAILGALRATRPWERLPHEAWAKTVPGAA